MINNFYRPSTKFGARYCFYTCLSFCPWESLYDATSCLAVWSDVPSSETSVPGPVPSRGVWRVSVQGGLTPRGVPTETPPGQITSPPIRKAGSTHLTGKLSC